MKKTIIANLLSLFFILASCSRVPDTMTGTTSVIETEGVTPSINTTEDADGDGYSKESGDCNDSEAAINPGATEELETGLIDENCDGFILQATETDCDDGVDNDVNGSTDCNDTVCSSTDYCPTVTMESDCTDGEDNETTSDGFVDCLDADCNADSYCDSSTDATETSCNDDVDSDGDSFIDCDDNDCDTDAACVVIDPETTTTTTTTPTLSLSTTDFGYPYDPLGTSLVMRWVSTSGSNYQSDGVTLNDCTTVTAPCADFTAALAQVLPGEIIAAFDDGVYSMTANLMIDKEVKIDGGYYWEDAEHTILAANPLTHPAILEFASGKALVVHALTASVAVTGLSIHGDHFPAVVRVVDSSPLFNFCRITAQAGIIVGQAVSLVNTGSGVMRPRFTNSTITVGDISGVASYESAAVAIFAENRSTGILAPIFTRNQIAVGRVLVSSSAPPTVTSRSIGLLIYDSMAGGQAVLNLHRNHISLDGSDSAVPVMGFLLSDAQVTSNTIIVTGRQNMSYGIFMLSALSGSESALIGGNLISLNRTGPSAGVTFGIALLGFNAEVSHNSLVTGVTTFGTIGLINLNLAGQTLTMNHNFLQLQGSLINVAVYNRSGSVTDMSYNYFNNVGGSSGNLVFEDGMVHPSLTNVTRLEGYLTSSISHDNLEGASLTDPDITWDTAFPFHMTLNAGSPLRDAGDPALTTLLPENALDVYRKARVVNSIIDIGAVEAQ